MYFVNTQPSLIYIETAYLMQIDHNYYRRPLAMLLNTHMSENVFPSQIFFGFLLTESYLHFTAACFHIRKQVKYEVKIKEEITYILWGHGNGDSASPTHHPQQTCFSSPTGWWCPRQLYNLLKLTNPHHNQRTATQHFPGTRLRQCRGVQHWTLWKSWWQTAGWAAEYKRKMGSGELDQYKLRGVSTGRASELLLQTDRTN